MLTLLLICLHSVGVYAQTHPVILGDGSQYDALRTKANDSPWSDMKDKAINQANTETYQYSLSYDEDSYGHYCHRMRSIMTACAMSYILDPSNQSFYVSKATEQMLDGLNYLIQNRPSTTGWTGNVPFGMALFETIIALDVLHNNMNPADRTAIENMLEDAVSSLRNNAWELSYHAVQGVWALYNNNVDTFNMTREAYRDKLLSDFSPDGVFYPGTGYAFTRMAGSERNQKHLFMDILEIQGYNDYYTNPVLKKGHEWMFGYASTPFGTAFPFGDTSPDSYAAKWTSNFAAYRASRFGAAAMEYANWHIEDPTPRPSLVLLVAMHDDYTPGQESIAPSKIFEDGGAWFRENETDKNILSGALWNCKNARTHSHTETNAISLAAYGELLLGNAGYNDFYGAQGSWTWEDIHDRAVTGNTVLIDYPLADDKDGNYPHDSIKKYGAGITEGLTTGVLDYACGDSGDALPNNGSHERNFMFVHPDNNAPGYWILMDKISGNPNANGHIALHPYSDNVTTVTANEKYRWAVKLYGETTTYLSIHLAHEPDKLQLLDGTATDGDPIPHKFLYNTYNLDENGEKEVITLLFPHQSSNDSPNTTNLNTANYTGSVVDLGNNIKDHVIESTNPTQSVNYDNNHSLTGNMSVFRTDNGNVTWYFVKSGTEFSSQNTGFTASAPISIFMDGNTGQVTTTNSTTVNLASSTACVGVELDGQTVSSTSNNGYLTFTLPAGTHNIQIIENAEDSDGDGVCDTQDVCPDFDDNLIGTTCDDGNPNTTGDVYTTSCNCAGTPVQTNGCELITNGDFNNDISNWGTWECDLNVSNGEAMITNISTSGDSWDAGLFQDGITLEQGKTYTLTFRARADADRGIYYKVGLPATSYFYKNANITTSMEDYTHTFTMDNATNTNVHVEFFFAHYEATVYIDDVSLVEDECGSNNCPPAGTSCNDDNPATENDEEDGFCNCVGTPCPFAGTSCDDGNPNTINDVEDGFCNCAGDSPDPRPDNYCNASGNSTNYEYIQQVIFGNINNDSGNNGGYGDFISQIADVGLGDTVPFSLTPGFSGTAYNEGWKIWIDFNRDGDYSDTGEEVYSGLSTSTLSGNVNIPTSALPGLTGMRIAMRWNSLPASCGTISYGEAEDYTVNILSTPQTYNVPPVRNDHSLAMSPSIRIHPNPVNDILNIGIQNASGKGMIRIYDLAGKPISHQIINEASTDLLIEVGHLPAGIYIIRLELGKDVYVTERFVKLSE